MAKKRNLSELKLTVLSLSHEEARIAASEMEEMVVEARDNGIAYNLYTRDGLQNLLWDWAENS